jgi:adenylate kinase family enzyme
LNSLRHFFHPMFHIEFKKWLDWPKIVCFFDPKPRLSFYQKFMSKRVHIMGAPGSGVTTLGRELAAVLGCPCFDVDDYHWFTSDPEPYRRRRNPAHRMQLLKADLEGLDNWVLSGSLCGWGDELIPRFTAVVWLGLPAELRLARIEARELARYGAARLEEGGGFGWRVWKI